MTAIHGTDEIIISGCRFKQNILFHSNCCVKATECRGGVELLKGELWT